MLFETKDIVKLYASLCCNFMLITSCYSVNW